MNTTVLDKINISVNRASWIHYSSPNARALTHSLGGQTINYFWVTLVTVVVKITNSLLSITKTIV